MGAFEIANFSVNLPCRFRILNFPVNGLLFDFLTRNQEKKIPSNPSPPPPPPPQQPKRIQPDPTRHNRHTPQRHPSKRLTGTPNNRRRIMRQTEPRRDARFRARENRPLRGSNAALRELLSAKGAREAAETGSGDEEDDGEG